jgi:glycosyltransferase involved in cell wall biosynthesis
VEDIKEEIGFMKTIAIDVRESGTSTGRYIDNLIKYLHELQPKHSIILLAKAHRIDYFKEIAPNFKIIESNFKEFTFSEQIGLLQQIKNLKPDLVHFGIVQQPILYRGKSITTIHDLTTIRFRNPAKNWLVFTVKRWVYCFVVWRVARKSLHILTPTEFVKNDVAKFAHINLDKITVTNEAGEELPEKEFAIAELENKKFIMFNGRPTPHKNLRRLIQAFKILRNNHPELLLVIAGKKDASHGSYVKFVKGLGLLEYVIFTDFIPDGQLKWAMKHAQAYIWASLSEGFGLPPLEAMLYGVPVVSSNATCMPEVLGDAAHYFNPTDVNDMAEKIDEVLSSPKLQEELVEKGKKQVRKYSWRRMAEQTLEVYNEVLDKNT